MPTPADLNPVGWWDASDDASRTMSGANLTSLADRSGNSRTMTAGGTVALATLNGLEVLDLGDEAGYLAHTAASAFITGTAASVAVLMRRNGLETGNGRVVSITAAAGPEDYHQVAVAAMISREGTAFPTAYRNFDQKSTGSITDTAWHVVMSVFDGTNHTMYVDGVAATADASTGTFNCNKVGIGAVPNGSDRYACEVAEVVLCDYALSSTDRTDLADYFDAKWLGVVPLRLQPLVARPIAQMRYR